MLTRTSPAQPHLNLYEMCNNARIRVPASIDVSHAISWSLRHELMIETTVFGPQPQPQPCSTMPNQLHMRMADSTSSQASQGRTKCHCTKSNELETGRSWKALLWDAGLRLDINAGVMTTLQLVSSESRH